MIDKFLKAKHWHLFLLLIGIPVIFIFLISLVEIWKLNFETNHDTMDHILILFPIMMASYTIVFFGWLWSMSIGIQNKLPKNINMKTKRFKIFFFYPAILINLFYITLCVSFLFNSGGYNVFPNNLYSNFSNIITPLYLASIFGIIHTIYFAAKTVKTVELQKGAKLGNYIGYFFAIWLYPFGIWFIQPKINKIVQLENNNTIDDIGKIDAINI